MGACVRVRAFFFDGTLSKDGLERKLKESRHFLVVPRYYLPKQHKLRANLRGPMPAARAEIVLEATSMRIKSV